MRRVENPYRARGLKSLGFRSGLQIVIIMLILVFIVIGLYACTVNAKKNEFNYEDADLIQLKVPKDDDSVVVFETTKGTFKAVLYKKEAPKCCDYFINLVKKGYFDGTYVYEVQDKVYFLAGSKSKSGKETEDTDTEGIEQEISPNLWPFKGAMMSYGPQQGTAQKKKIMSGSRILFVNSIEFTDEIKKELDSTGGTKEIINAFKTRGGVPNFSQQYTVFGQVYDGMDVYEEICGADVTDSSSLEPKEKIKFTKVYMSTYDENKNDSFFTGKTDSSQTDKTDTSSQTDSLLVSSDVSADETDKKSQMDSSDISSESSEK